MKKSIIALLLFVFTMGFTIQSTAQDVKFDPDALPKYIVMTVENTGLIGGIGLTIDSKKSPYQDQLYALEHHIVNRKEKRVRTITDLLNVMDEIGFEYQDAFNSRASGGGASTGVGSDTDVFGSSEKYRINLVFRRM